MLTLVRVSLVRFFLCQKALLVDGNALRSETSRRQLCWFFAVP
jgi:hypothetical protein